MTAAEAYHRAQEEMQAYADSHGLEFHPVQSCIYLPVTPEGVQRVVAWKWTHTTDLSYSVRSPDGRFAWTQQHKTIEEAVLHAFAG